MVLDIDLFRSDQTLEVIKENQKKRFQDLSFVDRVVDNDKEWRTCRFMADKLNKLKNDCSKEIGMRIKNEFDHKQEGEKGLDLLTMSIEELTTEMLPSFTITQLKHFITIIDTKSKETQVEMRAFENLRNESLFEVGNIVHNTVPVSNDENDNQVVYVSGDINICKTFSHVDLIQMIDGVDTEAGPKVAGGRGYYLKGPAVLLQMALVQMAIHKWMAKGYQPIYTPFFMRKEIMREVAQLSQFDEELYKMVGKSSETSVDNDEEKYLIATSEQPLAALHRDQWLPEASLPIRYIGQSTCFRQEVGSHGRDTSGIFRVHQFEKIEQFVLTSPLENKSWMMMEDMIDNCKEFYNELGIAYRVVNIVSGALNNSAAKKLDLEAWFPGSKSFRELVSCSNCLDYQSRRLLIRFGQTKKIKSQKSFVHTLNATACATTRVICAILETYQTPKGIQIPGSLQKYFPEDHPKVIPFVKQLSVK